MPIPADQASRWRLEHAHPDERVNHEGQGLVARRTSGIEGPLGELKTAISGSDIDAIRSATERLMTASQSFAQKLYESASRDQSAAAGSAGASSAPNDDEVVDAEIVDDEEGRSA